MEVARWKGYCPICEKRTEFVAEGEWFRDQLRCTTCVGGSIPRERAIKLVVDRYCPNWRKLRIHESSPLSRGASLVWQQRCKRYVGTKYWPDVAAGTVREGYRCENLEQQTFGDEVFDLVVSQDVMEHVFHPDLAYKEVWRTLRRGGYYIHTTPIFKRLLNSERRAELLDDGSIRHLAEPEYHGNPLDPNKPLVTFRYGYDIGDLIVDWAPFDVEIVRFNDQTHGIVAEMTEVIVCRKRANEA